MKPKLYLETTIPSYLTARPTRDPLMAGQISETKKWWRLRRNDFELFISPIVTLEANRGDASAARRRMQVLDGLPELPISPEVEELLSAIRGARLLPEKASADALHIAIAAAHRLHFLLTWNCTHINNREILRRLSGFAPVWAMLAPWFALRSKLWEHLNHERYNR